MPVPPRPAANRPGVPARQAAAPTRPPPPRVNALLASAQKAADQKPVERLPQLNCGDSLSQPNQYIVRLTDLTFFSDRDGRKVYCKILGRVVYAINGYTGEVVFPEAQATRPESYSKAQPAGASVTLHFYDVNNDDHGYNMQDMLAIMCSSFGIERTDMPGLFATLLKYAEFVNDAYKADVQAAFDGACQNTGVDPADYDVEPVSRDQFRLDCSQAPVMVKAYIGAYGKKSKKFGQMTTRRNVLPLDLALFPDFDYDLYLADAQFDTSADETDDADDAENSK